MHFLTMAGIYEVFLRYANGVLDCRWWIPVGVLGAVIFALPWTRRVLVRLPQTAMAYVTVAVICVLGVAWAWHLRWLCDDAYISFRYSRNLAAGHGLVFNP